MVLREKGGRGCTRCTDREIFQTDHSTHTHFKTCVSKLTLTLGAYGKSTPNQRTQPTMKAFDNHMQLLCTLDTTDGMFLNPTLQNCGVNYYFVDSVGHIFVASFAIRQLQMNPPTRIDKQTPRVPREARTPRIFQEIISFTVATGSKPHELVRPNTGGRSRPVGARQECFLPRRASTGRQRYQIGHTGPPRRARPCSWFLLLLLPT